MSMKSSRDRALSAMLCCFGFHVHRDPQSSLGSHKGATSKDTPTSTLVPGAAVPHTLNSPDALHRIFALNSSVHSYDIARNASPRRSTTQRSLDLNFRFDMIPHKKKPHGPLEQLTDHIKQRLSEGRLSRGSEQVEEANAAPIPLLETAPCVNQSGMNNPPGNSQNSVCLTDLLASRAASDGGYDSDAKSIQASAISSTAGTLKVSTKFVRGSLATIEGSQFEDIFSLQEQRTTHSPVLLPSEGNVCGPQSLSSTPVENIITDALQTRRNSSVRNERFPLSNDVASGTSSLPATPEQHDMASPYDSLPLNAKIVSLSAPARSSSLNRIETQVRHELHDTPSKASSPKLFSSADRAMRNITESSDSSLMSEVQPEPAQSVDKCDLLSINHEAVEITSPVTAFQVSPSQAASDVVAQDTVLSQNADREVNDIPAMDRRRSEESRSLHLFDMRISQRLASSSLIPVLPSTRASHDSLLNSVTSSSKIRDLSQARTSSDGRLPSFVSIKHTRCPSDPATRELFETVNQDRFRPSWRRSIAQMNKEGASQSLLKGCSTVADDSSSYYGSILDGTANDFIPLHIGRTKDAILNTNSIAVGGRSVSGPPLRKYVIGNVEKAPRHDSCRHKQTLDMLGVWNRDQKSFQEASQGRRVSVLKPSMFVRVDTTPTPVSRRLQTSTDANEKLSEIDVEHVTSSSTRPNSSVDTQTIEDRKNEKFSDRCSSEISLSTVLRNSHCRPKDGWPSRDRWAGWGFDITDDTSNRATCNSTLSASHSLQNSPRQVPTSVPQVECQSCEEIEKLPYIGQATENFQPKHKIELGLLGQPLHCHDQSVRECSFSSLDHRRSKSVDGTDNTLHRERKVEQKHRRSAPLLKTSAWMPPTPDRIRKLRKRSLMTLNRCVTTGIGQFKTGKSSIGDDTLGIWGRFPSRGRDQRNGPAGSADKVKVRDFEKEAGNVLNCNISQVEKKSASIPSLDVTRAQSRHLLSWRKPRMNRQKARSMNFVVPTRVSTKQARNGFAYKIKRLYHAKSSEIHAYALTQGHRSSVSTGLSVEYPELECLPSESAVKRTWLQDRSFASDTDGARDGGLAAQLDVSSELTSHQRLSVYSHTLPWTKKDAKTWSGFYGDCVGSLSALLSDEDASLDASGASHTAERKLLSLTSVLRDSTVEFEAELKRDTDAARQKLLKRVESSDEVSNSLRMPGSFD